MNLLSILFILANTDGRAKIMEHDVYIFRHTGILLLWSLPDQLLQPIKELIEQGVWDTLWTGRGEAGVSGWMVV